MNLPLMKIVRSCMLVIIATALGISLTSTANAATVTHEYHHVDRYHNTTNFGVTGSAWGTSKAVALIGDSRYVRSSTPQEAEAWCNATTIIGYHYRLEGCLQRGRAQAQHLLSGLEHYLGSGWFNSCTATFGRRLHAEPRHTAAVVFSKASMYATTTAVAVWGGHKLYASGYSHYAPLAVGAISALAYILDISIDTAAIHLPTQAQILAVFLSWIARAYSWVPQYLNEHIRMPFANAARQHHQNMPSCSQAIDALEMV